MLRPHAIMRFRRFRTLLSFFVIVMSVAIGSRGARAQSLKRPDEANGSVPSQPSVALDLAAYQRDIAPVLQGRCLDCHGPDTAEGNFRLDQLDPDLINGDDLEWWRDVFAVLTKGEMPPADAEPLVEYDRVRVVEWLADSLQQASRARRAAGSRSSLRRMTRYEFGYALQDLLGLPYDFARDLPPDAAQTDGFENGADTLQISAGQFMAYHEAARTALQRATVRGERPATLYWTIPMEEAAADVWPAEPAAEPAAFPRPYYRQRSTGQTVLIPWAYPEATYAWKPADAPGELPQGAEVVAVIPPRQKLIVELGDRVPDAGLLEIRALVSRPSDATGPSPSLQLEFGWQASNDSQAAVRISPQDERVEAASTAPQTIVWRVHAGEILPRNLVRGINQLGDLPNPSEFLRLVNSSVATGDIEVHAVEVTGPLYESWPPTSHTQLLGQESLAAITSAEELSLARQRLLGFMERAWRRPITPEEVDRKLALFTAVRAGAEDLQEAMIEVLAAVVASPNFLYLTGPEQTSDTVAQRTSQSLEPAELATRLSVFLWCSLPDDELRIAAAAGALGEVGALAKQAKRLLADARSRRFCEQFTRQWLDLDRLAYLQVDRSRYPSFDPSLVEAMRAEPAALFAEMLRDDRSVADLLGADYVMVNERLARHYGLADVDGNAFRRVSLGGDQRRGGLLTQAGLLAMNADGIDSHPLKRGVWLLERLLDDPPPPPPPAVPRIDLADPEIAKLTLKERLADHRNQAACRSCHERIDPWGIALENYDAVGAWRTEVAGKPVDAASTLFNGETLDGVVGLKQYLGEQRA
ncbi:MAG: DUF1592 domain-containing protein, partial [Pirellulales bacterium]